MKIEKAIEILDLRVNQGFKLDNPDLTDATRLGIEALKWIERNRYANHPYHIPMLPGETEDDTPP